MQNLTRYIIPVRTQAYVLLGMTVVWYVVTFGFGFTPNGENYWAVLCSLIPLTNLAFGLGLWASHHEQGRQHSGLVWTALLAALSPWMVFAGEILFNWRI